MAKLTFHGHATFSVETDDGTDLVIDPFFTDNPGFEGSVEDRAHGYDSIGRVVPQGRRRKEDRSVVRVAR